MISESNNVNHRNYKDVANNGVKPTNVGHQLAFLLRVFTSGVGLLLSTE